MALNVQTFKTRALSAVVFVILMLGALWLNSWSFILLFTLIHFGCWYEFIKLVKKISPPGGGWWIFSGLFYITLPIVLMMDLGTAHFSNISLDIPLKNLLLPTAIIFSIWINDTMAYIVGSFIGKTPFSKISPKKTWEGTAGGAILCVIVIAGLGKLLHYFNLRDGIMIAALAAIAGTIGDLYESKLKRLAGVKDSGSMMPGHGGFLDRFDSMLFAVPVVWLYAHLFMA